jgi:phage terminase large subunit
MTTGTYHIVEAPPEEAIYTPYGGCLDFFYSREPEVIAHGPVQTGKTLAACWNLHILCCKYPGAQLAIVRKTYKSLLASVYQTLKLKVLDLSKAPVRYFGGETSPTQIQYPNKSVIWLGGMDDPSKVLSSERDKIYYNQAEEGTLDE